MGISEETREWLKRLAEIARATSVPLHRYNKKTGDLTAGQGKMCSVSGNM